MIDIIFIVIFAIIVIHAALRGLVDEVSGWAWIILGGLCAVSFFEKGAAIIRTHTMRDIPYLPEVISFIVLYLIVFIAVKILSGMLREILEKTGLRPLNTALGLAFGVIKGIIILSAVVFIIRIQPLTDGNEFLKDSKIADYLNPIPHIIPLPKELQDV